MSTRGGRATALAFWEAGGRPKPKVSLGHTGPPISKRIRLAVYSKYSTLGIACEAPLFTFFFFFRL